MISALLVTLAASKKDAVLRPPNRGDRKIVVTRLYPRTEEVAREEVWRPPTSSGRCPVLLMPDTELAVFTHLARQTRHSHRKGTEIYTLIEGRMTLEVEGRSYTLSPGDAMVVIPGACHEVKRRGKFLCHVLTVNCGGPADKQVAFNDAHPARGPSVRGKKPA